MSKKPNEPKLTLEEKALQERVDAMMDPNRTEVAKVAADVNRSLAKELDIKPVETETKPQPEPETKIEVVRQPREQATTAPELPGKLKVKEKPPPKVNAEPEKVDQSTDHAPSKSAEPTVDIDDVRTDEAVDDIVAHESDTMLAIEDAKVDRHKQAVEKQGKKHGSGGWAWLLLALLIIGAGIYLYLTDYKALELIINP
jgi:hypothetical protein